MDTPRRATPPTALICRPVSMDDAPAFAQAAIRSDHDPADTLATCGACGRDVRVGPRLMALHRDGGGPLICLVCVSDAYGRLTAASTGTPAGDPQDDQPPRTT